MNKIINLSILLLSMCAIDWYLWGAVKLTLHRFSSVSKKVLSVTYWLVTILSLAACAYLFILPPESMGTNFRFFLFVGLVLPYLSKLFALLFLLTDDIWRVAQWVYTKLIPSKKTAVAAIPVQNDNSTKIPRSQFMAQASLIAGGTLFSTFGFGIISGAHDYRIRRVSLPLKNLPSAFHGIRIAQISDVHTGSFYNKTAVMGGVDMLLGEKPDVVFFTGDLVNDKAEEVKDYFEVFSKVTAPLGVYSTLGNHDYGDYARWKSADAKRKNLEDMHEAHRLMGWRLLLDENVPLTVDNEQIGIIGVENWGLGFAQYGSMEKAYRGTQDYPVKLLLSHDPTHWKAQVVPDYKSVDVMFAGHTHGMQFGVELPGFRWSPSQYRYEHWAGLYQKDEQYLYVNRGYGYIGYPGRVGILPEITIMELVKA